MNKLKKIITGNGLLMVLMVTLINLSFASFNHTEDRKYPEKDNRRDNIKDTKTAFDVFSSTMRPPFLTRTYDAIELDSMIVALYDERRMGSFNDYINDFIMIDVDNNEDKHLDSLYKGRLEMMASVIKLPYNTIVRSYINTYAKNKGIQNFLGPAMYYMPLFERELYRMGLPTELKILPIVESGLNPTAVSHAGAAGLWQFMYMSGKMYGLKVNSFVDERFDPIKSTQAACKLLRDLYNIYNDWTLVLAAYNCGAGNVNKAIKRAKNARSYWDIYEFLPRETRGYVPAFIGATYAYTFHKAHNMTIKLPSHPITTDTVHITNRMLHFGQVSSTLDIPIETLKALNPSYRLSIVPALEGPASLTLPTEYISQFIEKESEIYAKENEYLKDFKNTDNLKITTDSYLYGRPTATYKLKSGDLLQNIAKKYRVRVSDLIKWNNIKDARKLRIGQVIKIYK